MQINYLYMCLKHIIMVFHRERRKYDHEDIILNNNILQQVHCTKFLGIIIANHIVYIKIAKGMGILLKVRKVLKIQVLLQLYHSFVFPYLIYCSKAWSTASDIHIQPLIILHNFFLIISFPDITLQLNCYFNNIICSLSKS